MARVEPNNIDAEISILGCAFLSKEALEKVIEGLETEMFYSKRHQLIFEAIKDLYKNDVAIDITTVVNELERKKELSKVGGVEYLTEIIDSVVTPSNIEYYINIVFTKYILRTIINKSSDIIDECYKEEKDINDIIDYAEKSILGVDSDRMIKDISDIQHIIVNVQENIERLAKEGTDITGIPSGYYDLDAKTTGFHDNELIIIAGRPGMGKSSIASNMITNMAINSKKSVALFTLETGAEQVVNRMLASVGQISANKLKTGRLDHNDWKKLNEAIGELGETNIFIDDTADITINEIRRKSRKLKNSSRGLDIIFVDYLQLITSTTKYSGQRVQEVSEISRGLKKLAMELEIPVVAVAQLSRSVEMRENKRPIMSDLKESGSIEQDADIVLFLYCDDYYNYKAKERPNISPTELIISKHRNGATGVVELLFERNTVSFKNYIKRDQENEK